MDKYIKLHNVDFEDLIKTIDECKGDVYLETIDGDVLNLKSKLCPRLAKRHFVALIPKMKQFFLDLIFTAKFRKRSKLWQKIL